MKSASPAVVRADRRLEQPWGPHTFASRCAKERARSPEIAALKVGQQVTVEFEGKPHTATVLKDGYRYDGNQWPTLYSIVKEITGTVERQKQLVSGKRPAGTRQLCNWSAVRFWRLRQLLASLGVTVTAKTKRPGTPSPQPKQAKKTPPYKERQAKRLKAKAAKVSKKK